MQFTAQQIADIVGGRVEGDANVAITDFAKIEEGRAGCISFLSNAKYKHFIYETQSTVCLIDESITLEKAIPSTLTLIRVKSAYESVAHLLQLYNSMMPKKTGIDPLAFVSPTAHIGKNTYIAPFAYIGDNVTVGDNCQINPHVTIYHNCKIGNNCILHAGVVIGADGFGFAPTEAGYEKIPQIGNVVIEDDVEIGANTCIDRSTMGSTVIRKGVKLDNLIQIAHNCEVGSSTVMSAQVGVAGSTKIGQWCMLGGQAGISGHTTIGDKCKIGPQTGTIGNIKTDSTVIGSPAMDHRTWLKANALFRRLPEMAAEIETLKKEIKELKENK